MTKREAKRQIVACGKQCERQMAAFDRCIHQGDDRALPQSCLAMAAETSRRAFEAAQVLRESA